MFFILAFPGCGGDRIAARNSLSGQGIDLSGQWKIMETDDAAARRPDYNDSRAVEIAIPGKWDFILKTRKDLTATVWLRKKFFVDPAIDARQMVLSLGPVSIADETYLNGVFIGSTGKIPGHDKPLSYDFTWHRERHYVFDSSILRKGAVNVIAIRVFSHYINGIKDVPVLCTMEKWKQSYPFNDYIPALNNLMPLILALLLSLILIVIAWGKVSPLVYFYVTLFVLNVCFIYLLLLGIPSFSDGLLRFRFFFSIYALTDFFLLLATRGYFEVKSKWPMVLILAALAGVHVLIIFSPDAVFFFRYAKIALLVFLVVCVGYTFGIFIQAFMRDPMRYWIVVPLAFFVILSAVDTYYLIATDQMYRISFLFILRIIALALGVLFYFLFDFRRIEKERDSLAQALLKKTRELRQVKSQASSVGKKEDPRDIIHRVIEYIDANFNETYDRIGLAEKFGLNEDYMGQVFKKATGTNITSYINNKRIEAARQLLEETDSKVIDIAFHVGFDNLTNFYRKFRSKTGYNPTEYRNMMRKGYINIHMKDESEYY